MPLGMEVNLGISNVVLDRVAVPPPKSGRAPSFSVRVYCGQTAGRMKTPLGTEVDFGPDCVVLDGEPAPPPAKGAKQPPLFGGCLL